LREEIEELHRLLDAKEHNLAESRRLASEKDQMVLEMASVVKESEAKHEASIMDLKDKHQMVIVGFESQLADSVKERSKVDEMVTSLQALLADKESQLVEVEAASSGELVRLGALLEAARGDSARLTLEHKKQQEEWELAVTQLKSKLEASEELQIQLAASAAKTRSELESELERIRQTLSASQAELGRMRDEAAQRAEELAAYKVRAYALLQKKEAELSAAQDSELVAAKEAALQEAKKEAAAAGAERDRAVQALQATVTKYQTQLDARAGAILEAEQHIRELATKLESSKSLMLSQQVEWHARLQQVEEACRVKCEAAEAKAKVNRPDETDLANELSALHSTHEQLKVRKICSPCIGRCVVLSVWV
jgi:DNA repair exonuclease SbcCD ATPase subunit